MTVDDILSRIDYELMIESNTAGAAWLLDEFERKRNRGDVGVFVRPMIEVLNEHNCSCEIPGAWSWSYSSDGYHSCGDVVCSECERTIHERDASWISYATHDYHSGRWVCQGCQPPPPVGDTTDSQEMIEIPLHLIGAMHGSFHPASTPSDWRW